MYYNIVKAAKYDKSYPFYVLVSGSDKEFITDDITMDIWNRISEKLGESYRDGMWGKHSINSPKIQGIMKELGIERSVFIKIPGQRTV